MSDQKPAHVCINPWHFDDNGNQTYSHDGEPIHGWSVYVRSDPEDALAEPYEVFECFDSESEEDAVWLAGHLLAKHKLPEDALRRY